MNFKNFSNVYTNWDFFVNAENARVNFRRAHFVARVFASSSDGWARAGVSQLEPSMSRYSLVQVAKPTIFKKYPLLTYLQQFLLTLSETNITKMAAISSQFPSQISNAVYKRTTESITRKPRITREIVLPELPKVIDGGNGRRYFRGRLLGKVKQLSSFLNCIVSSFALFLNDFILTSWIFKFAKVAIGRV